MIAEASYMELDPVAGILRFDPAEFGLNLSWDDFQAQLADEFDAYNEELLRDVDRSPEAQEYARLSVLDLLLNPASGIEFCDRFRNRINCALVDPMILRVLWQNRVAIDAVQRAKD